MSAGQVPIKGLGRRQTTPVGARLLPQNLVESALTRHDWMSDGGAGADERQIRQGRLSGGKYHCQ